ncbi:CLUMA_CG003490, isoform A [Clunio marinus]|uniref:CLUMA_CG003490, isoform A n=1 Tax=Clunio marinus TaxID=568069 RepID=A0A1J1HUK5_9DIPT|nr:CLUMA_CG003490, isoform A [Clunio marinus]
MQHFLSLGCINKSHRINLYLGSRKKKEEESKKETFSCKWPEEKRINSFEKREIWVFCVSKYKAIRKG